MIFCIYLSPMRGTDLGKEKRISRFFSLIRVWDTRECYMKEE
jgi:hypothetical protein